MANLQTVPLISPKKSFLRILVKVGEWGRRNLEFRLMRYRSLAVCHPIETTKFENCSPCSPQIQVAYAPVVHC